jgi:hypothetical protein
LQGKLLMNLRRLAVGNWIAKYGVIICHRSIVIGKTKKPAEVGFLSG